MLKVKVIIQKKFFSKKVKVFMYNRVGRKECIYLLFQLTFHYHKVLSFHYYAFLSTIFISDSQVLNEFVPFE